MPASTKPAPRGTRALTAAIMDALESIPEVSRKAAFKHASAAVKEKLVAQAEKAKAASRAAPARPGAKRNAAVAATRKAAAAQRGKGTEKAVPAPVRRGGRRRAEPLPDPSI